MPCLRTHASALTALLLAVALASCGGKNKGSQTPGGGDGTSGMQPSEPGAVSTTHPGRTNPPPDPNQPTGPDGTPEMPPDPGISEGGGLEGGGTEGDGDGSGGAEDGPLPAKAEPPVTDISEEEARQQVEVHIKRARAELAKKNQGADAAIEAAKKALSIDPNNVEAVVLLAHAYYFKQLYSTAEVIVLRALSSPNKKISQAAERDAYLFYVRGLIYDATAQAEKAELAYEKAHELDANHRGAIMNLGVHYIRDSRYAEAEALFVKLTGQLGVKTAAAWTNLGSAYRGRTVSPSLSKPQRDSYLLKAETAFKRAIQADKNYAPAYFNLALLYMDAEPFPQGGKAMDMLARLGKAKTYFDEYRALPGADINRVDELIRDVSKAIKKEKKRREKAASGEDDW